MRMRGQPGTEDVVAAIEAPESEHRAQRFISTGSTEIDKKMGGGIPEGSLILIEGESNAGKSVVSQQLTFGALNSFSNSGFLSSVMSVIAWRKNT